MDRNDFLDEAIAVELNMMKLYLLYSTLYKGNRDFWMQLAKEEKHHSVILELAEEFFKSDNFPEDIVYEHLQEMKDINKSISGVIEKVKAYPFSEKEACETAIKFETSSFELHYQNLLQKKIKGAEKVFNELNNGDKDHVRRIKELDIV